ncbi:MAG: CBS domain-containing protein [Bradyrhizobium sp.]|uniref:CBS domain-containing protein n=1 Tax=Bradyrhizobium sp. TaxID=376 RepID=UPI0027266F0F|nr:CBS domain-containing protein [Bradyrhizobium sp.]MDO9564439.1 CBS domain-containing protein [Bradyrhizobium sp.]MDP3692644.1 CBS domain-containing protein [Bradyrhizobium sp.]
MRAHQIMTRKVITVKADTSIREAADLMLQQHISGLPVVDDTGKLIGVVSEGDFMRRGEIGTQGPRIRWLDYLMGPGKSAVDFVREYGRRVGEIMSRDELVTATEDMPLEQLVRVMERENVKRIPILRGDALVGIVTRSDLLRAVASLAREVPDPTADDDHIRSRVISSIEQNEWHPTRLAVTVRDGIVHLSGMITDERYRQATIVAAENVPGVKLVHDHLCLFDAMSGLSFPSPEDEGSAKAG